MLQVTNEIAKSLISALESKGYRVFENDARNYNLNIVGVRSDNRVSDSFDDTLIVFWKYQGKWNFRSYKITTDPGKKSLLTFNPSLRGCAILKVGQYLGAYVIGKHKGQYTALVQRGADVTVIRDSNRDNLLDYDSGIEATGKFGINIHRSNPRTESQVVGGWSAGCQVFSRARDFDEFMDLVRKSAALHGGRFTYTLIKEADLGLPANSLHSARVA